MIPIISLLIILFLSLLTTRIATIALMHTGLSKNVAKFQARSALSTCGFSTSESERIMNHPIRRKIILTLMLLGNIGVITVLSSLLLTFIHLNTDQYNLDIKLITLFGGLLFLWFFTTSSWIEKNMAVVIDFFLDKYLDLQEGDFRHLLHVHDEHKIIQFSLAKDNLLLGQTFKDNLLKDNNLRVLSIQRENGDFIGSPKKSTQFKEGDLLTVFGSQIDFEIIRKLQTENS